MKTLYSAPLRALKIIKYIELNEILRVGVTNKFYISGMILVLITLLATRKAEVFCIYEEQFHYHLNFVQLEKSSSIYEWKILPKNGSRFEVPYSSQRKSYTINEKENSQFNAEVSLSPFRIVATRHATNRSIFDTAAAQLVYDDRFLQLGTFLESEWIYGLGEDSGPLLRKMGHTHTLWARGHYEPG